MKKYIRTTHINGQYKDYPFEVELLWSETYMGFVGHMLDPNNPLTTEEIRENCLDYKTTYPDSDTPLDLGTIQKYVDLLVKFDMAKEI